MPQRTTKNRVTPPLSPDDAARGETNLLEPNPFSLPRVGLALRHEWVDHLLVDEEAKSLIDYVEVFPENYLTRRSRWGKLSELREQYGIVSHGVHMNLGGEAGEVYLEDLQRFVSTFEIPWCSDHLGLSVGQGGNLLFEIFPVPFNTNMAHHVRRRAIDASERLGRSFLVENSAYYLMPEGTTMGEAEFFQTLFRDAPPQIGMLLDVNNLFVNATNHGYDPSLYLDSIPLERVQEIHIGGFHEDPTGLLIDSHSSAPSQDVFDLLELVAGRVRAPITLEWESNARVEDAIEAIREIHRRLRFDDAESV